jgi:phospholipase C
MANILPQVKNIVVVMMENRSLDNLCGWLYSNPAPAPQPSLYLPAGSTAAFNGLNPAMWNPSNVSYFSGQAPGARKSLAHPEGERMRSRKGWVD